MPANSRPTKNNIPHGVKGVIIPMKPNIIKNIPIIFLNFGFIFCMKLFIFKDYTNHNHLDQLQFFL